MHCILSTMTVFSRNISHLILSYQRHAGQLNKYPVNESVSDIPITDGSPLSAVLLSDGLRRCQSHIRQLFDF